MHSYQAFLEAAMAERDPDHLIWEDNDKLHNRQLGELCGLRVPELYQGPCSLRKMTPPTVPAVIKPVSGCSARGVVPLVPNGDRYTNLFTGRRTTWEQAVVEALAAKHTPRNKELLKRNHPDAMRPPWLLEELILKESGGMPFDWKGFCVGGRVQVIKQSLRRPDGNVWVKWYDRGWKAVGDIAPVRKWKLRQNLPRPASPGRLVEAFEAAAALVDSPFIRVDLYEDVGGKIVFGETTPHPTGGGVRFVPEWDRRLGEAWAAALN